jgi:hypothetical protein
MNTAHLEYNLLIAWLWLVLGSLSGLGLGLFFHREDWLGGYSSFRRRLYRLAHISFFGLGVVNLCFYLTARCLPLAVSGVSAASIAFILGALTMPVCCVVMAHQPRARWLFALPVVSLLAGGLITIALVLHSRTGGSGGPAFTLFQP